MPQRIRCPACGDSNFPTDPFCLSCGQELIVPKRQETISGSVKAQVSAAKECEEEKFLPKLTQHSPSIIPRRRRRALEQARLRRQQRIKELTIQVEALIQQGYHRLPRASDQKYGPADDVSDLCRQIGQCYAKNDDLEEAARWFERALVLAPQNIPARAYLVGVLCELGRYEEARAYYEETPGDPIDKNVVASWLELPDGSGAENVLVCRLTDPISPSPVPGITPSEGRVLALHDEVRVVAG
ncbi:MAG: tetratricopeptide repeat protein [Candidatus Zipacnadales bacterium]